MAFTQTTIQHHFENADGTPASGTVTFALTKRITNGTTTLIPAEITAALDASGNLSQVLTSNVDTGTVPFDSEWRVDFRILGSSPAVETFFIQVPVGPGSADLGALLPADATGG